MSQPVCVIVVPSARALVNNLFMFRLRPFLHLTLVLTVLLTAQVMGAARGQARVAGELVICSGQGVVTLRLDADGNPVDPPMICPDCALTLLVQGISEGGSLAPPVSVTPVIWPGPVAAPVKPATPVHTQARAPPGTVRLSLPIRYDI